MFRANGAERHGQVRRANPIGGFLVRLLLILSLLGAQLVFLPTALAASSSSNLADFTSAVTFEGVTENPDGTITVKPGASVGINLTFAERSGLQFDDASMTYQLPTGFLYANGTGSIAMQLDGGTMYVPYTMTESGLLTVTWPQDDPLYPYFTDASNARFSINVQTGVGDVAGVVQFGNGITRTFELDGSHGVSVRKNGSYSDSEGKIHYTVTVDSVGTNTNVDVSDSVTGTALTLDTGSIRVMGNSSPYTISSNGDGYQIVFASMGDKEQVRITYSATVDYSRIQGPTSTAEETSNSVTVKPDDGDANSSSNDFSNQISSSRVGKSGVADSGLITVSTAGGEKSYRRVDWTIDANTGLHVPLAGGSIADSIADGSQDIMRYAGDGITVKVFDVSGSLVDTRAVSWTDLGVVSLDSASSWTYNVPGTDGIYRYQITYSTMVDVTGAIDAVPVANSVTETEPDGDGFSGNAQVTVAPEFDFNPQKVATAITDTDATWVITVNVPKGGYDDLVVVDELPSTWLVDRHVYDTLVPDSINVQGLAEGESYHIDTSATGKVSLTFFQDAGRTIPGLSATGGERHVTITLRTRFDEAWVATASDWQKTHTNTARVTANQVTRNTSAQVIPLSDKTVAKDGAVAGPIMSVLGMARATTSRITGTR